MPATASAAVPATQPYGFCPRCGAAVVERTRGGAAARDTCASGHVYPSGETLATAADFGFLRDRLPLRVSDGSAHQPTGETNVDHVDASAVADAVRRELLARRVAATLRLPDAVAAEEAGHEFHGNQWTGPGGETHDLTGLSEKDAAFVKQNPYLYHITGQENLHGIIEKGLKVSPSKQVMRGRGVYFATTPEATQYYHNLDDPTSRLFRVQTEHVLKKAPLGGGKGQTSHDEHEHEVVTPHPVRPWHIERNLKGTSTWEKIQSVDATASDTVHAADPAPSPNQSHAAFAVLRAARLVGVGNWLADLLQSRAAQLEKTIAQDILQHANGWSQNALPSLFATIQMDADRAFDWMTGEATDQLRDLQQVLDDQTRTALKNHHGDGTAPTGSTDSDLPLVLGASVADHLGKLKDDLLFRVRSGVQQALAAGATAADTVQRLGLVAEAGKVKVKASNPEGHNQYTDAIGSTDSNGGVKHQRVENANHVEHGELKLGGGRRWRYFGKDSHLQWTDEPDKDEATTTKSFLDGKGFHVEKHTLLGYKNISATVHAADPLIAISIGVRLFDTTDNSLMKFLQLAVTALAQAADEDAEDELDDDDEAEDKRIGFTWVSAGDANVCPFCEHMDGAQFTADKEPVGDGPELETEPPAHFGCRCALISCDLDEEKPTGSFSDYLAGFSKHEQEQAFGKAALRAYRRGEITPAQLMGNPDRKISIDEFRAMGPRTLPQSTEDIIDKAAKESADAANERTRLRRLKRIQEDIAAQGRDGSSGARIRARAADIALSCKAVVTNGKGEILVLDDARSDWADLPGGHCLDGEPPQQALEREVKEETGLDIYGVEELGAQVLPLDSGDTMVLLYTAMLAGDPRLDDSIGGYATAPDAADPVLSAEHTGWHWVAEKDLGDHNLGVFAPLLERWLAQQPVKASVRAEEVGHEFHGNQWTERQPMSPDQRKAKIDRLNQIKQELAAHMAANSQDVGASGMTGLTRDAGAKFRAGNKELSDIRFDLAKPLDMAKLPSEAERQSTLPASVVQTAHNDLMRDRAVWSPIADAAVGVSHGSNTAVDDVMLGRDPNITAQKFYDNFSDTRAAMRQHYGDTVELHRAVGRQIEKPTTNWATTKEFARQFGSNIVTKRVPIENVVAVNVGPFGKYHEVIVGTPPQRKLVSATAQRGAVAAAEQRDEPATEAVTAANPEGHNQYTTIGRLNQVADSFGHPKVPTDWSVTHGAQPIPADQRMEARLCYSNALAKAQTEGYEIHTGVVMDKEVHDRLMSENPKYISTTNHAWNVKDGKVYDFTLGKSSDVYIGHKVDEASFKNGEGVQSDLVDKLYPATATAADTSDEARDEQGRWTSPGQRMSGGDIRRRVRLETGLGNNEAKALIEKSGLPKGDNVVHKHDDVEKVRRAVEAIKNGGAAPQSTDQKDVAHDLFLKQAGVKTYGLENQASRQSVGGLYSQGGFTKEAVATPDFKADYESNREAMRGRGFSLYSNDYGQDIMRHVVPVGDVADEMIKRK